MKMASIKALTALGRREKNQLCDPGSELRLNRGRTRRAKLIDGIKRWINNNCYGSGPIVVHMIVSRIVSRPCPSVNEIIYSEYAYRAQ